MIRWSFLWLLKDIDNWVPTGELFSSTSNSYVIQNQKKKLSSDHLKEGSIEKDLGIVLIFFIQNNNVSLPTRLGRKENNRGQQKRREERCFRYP